MVGWWGGGVVGWWWGGGGASVTSDKGCGPLLARHCKQVLYHIHTRARAHVHAHTLFEFE